MLIVHILCFIVDKTGHEDTIVEPWLREKYRTYIAFIKKYRIYCAMIHSAKRGLAIACRPSVCPYVCDVGGSGSHKLKILKTNCTDN